jgi:phospholipase C
MLGFMKSLNPAIDGLNGDEWNYPARELDPKVVVTPAARDVHYLTPDPHHDFGDVTAQSFSNGTTGTADMLGFVRDYYTLSQDPVRAGNVMKCFTPATLPVLTTLAARYGVCDRWFAAVPGSTIPNRMFVHGANIPNRYQVIHTSAPTKLHRYGKTRYQLRSDGTLKKNECSRSSQRSSRANAARKSIPGSAWNLQVRRSHSACR